MIVDSHVHLWRLSRGDYGWLTPDLGALYRDFSPDDLERTLSSAGVNGAIVVQAAPTLAETDYLLELAEANAAIRGVVGWVDLTDRRAPEYLEHYRMRPAFKGVRPMLQDIPDDDHVLGSFAAPIFEVLQATGQVFEALVRPRHLPRLIELRKRYPRLRMIVDHGAKPDIASGEIEPWASDLRALALDGLTMCKLSGLATEARPGWTTGDLQPFAAVILEAFGPRRTLWGSDWPVAVLATEYGAWLSAAREVTETYSTDERGLIFGGLATQVYSL